MAYFSRVLGGLVASSLSSLSLLFSLLSLSSSPSSPCHDETARVRFFFLLTVALPVVRKRIGLILVG